MVIDDDENIRQLLTHMLTKQGYTIIEASDGLEGIEKLKSELPDMVMVDVNMPVMDGFEFCEVVSSLSFEKYIPVMIMTAQDDQESVIIVYGFHCEQARPLKNWQAEKDNYYQHRKLQSWANGFMTSVKMNFNFLRK